MITKEDLQEFYNISEELFQSAGISWEELTEIFDDFNEKKANKYEPILKEFISTYLDASNLKNANIHSIRYRVKSPEHLVVKVIRKKQENFKKYKNLNKSNYEKFITDLIGIRCFILFKKDWEDFHNYILGKFENNVNFYIRDSIRDFDDNIEHWYLAEKPKVHIRNGDDRTIYEKALPPDCVIDDKVYRSVHYIIKYQGIYLEIQVRTLFEEGWGEVDHAIVYPYYQDDKVLKEYTELLNRLTGLADEMSSFFVHLRELEKENYKQSQSDAESIIENPVEKTITEKNQSESDMNIEKTFLQCLQTVLDE